MLNSNLEKLRSLLSSQVEIDYIKDHLKTNPELATNLILDFLFGGNDNLILVDRAMQEEKDEVINAIIGFNDVVNYTELAERLRVTEKTNHNINLTPTSILDGISVSQRELREGVIVEYCGSELEIRTWAIFSDVWFCLEEQKKLDRHGSFRIDSMDAKRIYIQRLKGEGVIHYYSV